jgi:hypothetical protein
LRRVVVICDATVTAVEGDHREMLTPVACRHVGVFERPGTYVVRAERTGFIPVELTDVGVMKGTDDCPHVETVRVQIRLPQS